MAATLLQRNARIASTQLDDDVVLMCSDSGKYYSLTGPARRIWELLAEPLSPSSLCSALAAEYTVDAETCRNDTNHFLQDMQARMLIQEISHT